MKESNYTIGLITAFVILTIFWGFLITHSEPESEPPEKIPFTQYSTILHTDADVINENTLMYMINRTPNQWINLSYEVERTGPRNHSIAGRIEIINIGTVLNTTSNIAYDIIERGPDGMHIADIENRNITYPMVCTVWFDSAGVEWYNISIKLNDAAIQNAEDYSLSRITIEVGLYDDWASSFANLEIETRSYNAVYGGIDQKIDIDLIILEASK